MMNLQQISFRCRHHVFVHETHVAHLLVVIIFLANSKLPIMLQILYVISGCIHGWGTTIGTMALICLMF
jgi:hypothetical protein